MIASRDVASAWCWVRLDEEHEARHEQHAAADTEQAREQAAGEADRRADHLLHQLDRAGEQHEREQARDPSSDRRCWSQVPITPGDRRHSDQQGVEHVDVAVQALCSGREGGDEDDRRERGPGGRALVVAEPEHQQGHDDGAAANAEKSAEETRQRADRDQLERPRRAVISGRVHEGAGERRCAAY